MLSGKGEIHAITWGLDKWIMLADLLFYMMHYIGFALIKYFPWTMALMSFFSLTLSYQPWYPRSLQLVNKMHYLAGHQKIEAENVGSSQAGWGKKRYSLFLSHCAPLIPLLGLLLFFFSKQWNQSDRAPLPEYCGKTSSVNQGGGIFLTLLPKWNKVLKPQTWNMKQE